MSRSRSRIMQALVLGAAATLVVSGCAAGGGASGDGGSATSGTVNWWSWTPDNDLAEREIAAFNEEYPDIEVVYKKIPSGDYNAVMRPALASNEGPDVFTVAAVGTVGPIDLFGDYATDLTADAEKLMGADWKSQVWDLGVEAFTDEDDRFVAMPWARIGAGGMWINQDLFDQFQLEAPTNLQEWKEVCEVFRSNGYGCFREGVGAKLFDVDTLHSIVNSIEPGLYEKAIHGEAEWTDPAIVEAFEIFASLESEGILDPGSVGIQQYPDVNNAFLSGEVAMVQMGSWYAQYMTTNSMTAALAGAGVPASTEPITIVPVDFPDVAGKGNPPTLFIEPDAAQAVNAKSKVRNAATTFALWLGGTESGQQAVTDNMDSVPTLKGIEPKWDSLELVNPDVQLPLLQELYADYSAATEQRKGLPGVNLQAIADANQAVVSGQATPEEGAASIQAVFDANPVSE
ncbi:ABC transporter substrate-binding protein [Microbacterium sp. GXF0217]